MTLASEPLWPRKPRGATIVKHRSARASKQNVFTYSEGDLSSGELTWGFRHPVQELPSTE